MNRVYFGIALFLLNCALVFSQELNEDSIKQKNIEFEMEIRSEEYQCKKLQKQGDSLAIIIQQLKSEKNLNIFERQKLEQLFKKTQELEIKNQEKRQRLEKTEEEYQIFLHDVIVWCDGQIQSYLALIENKKKGTQAQRAKLKELYALKKIRKEYFRKLKPLSIPVQINASIEINEFDSYEKIIQKADVVKDQEDKVRKKLSALKERMKEAENELTLRNKMNELISDTYLMEHQSETLISSRQSEKGKTLTWDGETLNSEESVEISLNNFDHFLKSDVSEFSNMDLEFYLQNLKSMISKLNHSADSLQLKAETFYRSAEKKREEYRK